MKSNYFKKISVIILIIAVLPIFDYTPLRNSGIKFVKYAEARKKYKKYRRYRRRRARTFALNFKDVEISEFVNIMSKLTGKNIILSDRVRGKITIISPRKIPVYNAFNIMKSILEVKGFAVVRSGNLYKIVRVREAIKQNVEIYVDGKKLRTSSKGKDIITYLYKLKNADSSDILNALRPLKSRNTNIVVYQPTNTLILSGIQTEINGLIEIAKQLDKKVEGPGGQTGNIHVVHLENAVAEDLANVLSRVPFSETAKINTSPLYNKRFTRKTRRRTRRSRRTRRIIRNRYIKSKKKSKLSIIPNKATNSLIITATPAEFRQILRVIKQ